MADPTTIINNAVKSGKSSGKKWIKPENADRARLETQKIRGTRGTEKIKSKLRREDRAHAKEAFKDERAFEHGERRTTRTHLREESVTGAAQRSAIQDSRQRSYARFRAQQQLELNQARMQQRADFQRSQQPGPSQTVLENAVAKPTMDATTNIVGGLFRVMAVIVGLSMLYLVVSRSQESTGFIASVGGFLHRLTGTTPLVSVKNTPAAKKPL